jgi:hypothetical protein
MSNLPEQWVPAEVPENHWSKSNEWAEYKAQQKQLAKDPESAPLQAFQKVGTVTPGTRTKTTHELQMESCQVEWFDPNPNPLVEDAVVVANGTHIEELFLEELARTLVEKVSKVVDNS